MSWRELNSYIPRYLREQTEMLRRTKKGVKAIFVDSGDTLIDEGSQLFSEDRSDLVLSARPIDTSRQLINELKERGYLVALVADGLEQSFRNVLRANGFWDHFDAMAISENCGVSKPHPRMFQEAMLELGLRPEDAEGIIMLGNNLARDIRGANALGLTSVWIDWVDRYDKTPKDDIEKPDFTISKPIELLEVIEKTGAIGPELLTTSLPVGFSQSQQAPAPSRGRAEYQCPFSENQVKERRKTDSRRKFLIKKYPLCGINQPPTG
ncbi:HAD family hydrolase [uncultured Cohaesibacter sp.]|uniref:HAD family hydrolase n=1 Tax=uncultured Cohaesibacter sp. TaxID=1002546 RepID=UPI002931F652|nr:HAD family hydrolase [uncultured Cohaesibacter sp.]